MPTDQTARWLERVLTALSDPQRARILSILAEKEVTVSALAEVLHIVQPIVSRQLARLRDTAVWRDPGSYQRDEESAKRLTDAEQRVADYTSRILATIGDSDLGVLISQLLEFHRREAKPQYWAMYDRRDSTTDELIDDAECLGGLTRDTSVPPYKEKRSIVYSYKFPPQDFKLSVGDDCLHADTLKSAGKIVAVDDEKNTISLKIGATQPALPEEMSIIPTGPIDAITLREAIYRYADAVIAKTDRYRAITAILNRERPRLSIPFSNGSLVSDHETELDSALRVIPALDESALSR